MPAIHMHFKHAYLIRRLRKPALTRLNPPGHPWHSAINAQRILEIFAAQLAYDNLRKRRGSEKC
jgi:hypothetical protein